MNKKESALILITCPDRQGISAAVTAFLYKNRGNIIDIDQHVDRKASLYFMRVKWDLDGFKLEKDNIKSTFQKEIADRFKMHWELYFTNKKSKMAIFVSSYTHCLYEILACAKARFWNVDIPLIISNHKELKGVAETFGVEFKHIPKTKEDKKEKEKQELKLLKKCKIDFIVLARYMQIFSDDFIKNFPNSIINIHHSFLPAFPGANPYHSAFKKGVKIIGATSHYITKVLDEGPIIEQDIIRVSHRDNVEDLIRKGQDLEKIVLSRAIWYHMNRMIVVHGNRTIVFR